jgi:uncharacterized protein
MKLIYRTIFIALVALLCNEGIAQVPEKPAQASPIVDLAGIIKNDSLVSELNAQLDSLSKQTQNQIVVVTVNDMGGLDPKEFATELGKSWGVGGNRLNNGFVMVVKPKDENGPGQIGFATGYGLEGALPDVFCKRLQADYMIPHFKEGDYAGGIKAAIDEIVPVVLDDYSNSQSQALASEGSKKKGGTGNGWLIFAVILGLVALVVTLRRRNKKNTGVPQQPQADKLTSEQEQNADEENVEKDEENDKDDNEPDDDKHDNKEPEPYKYGYGGGDFGGGGASSTWE